MDDVPFRGAVKRLAGFSVIWGMVTLLMLKRKSIIDPSFLKLE